MLDAIEAAEKISTATADLRRAQTARPSAFSNATIKAAERRLAMLLAVLVHFKGDPDFDATYRGRGVDAQGTPKRNGNEVSCAGQAQAGPAPNSSMLGSPRGQLIEGLAMAKFRTEKRKHKRQLFGQGARIHIDGKHRRFLACSVIFQKAARPSYSKPNMKCRLPSRCCLVLKARAVNAALCSKMD